MLQSCYSLHTSLERHFFVIQRFWSCSRSFQIPVGV